MNSISPSFRPPSAFFAVLCLPDYAVQAGVLCVTAFKDFILSSIHTYLNCNTEITLKSSIAKNAERELILINQLLTQS